MAGSALPMSVVAGLAAAAGEYLRLSPGMEAPLLARLAGTAIGLCERFCGQAIVARTWEDVLPVSPDWQRLAGSPVTAIAGLTALPVAGAPFVLPVGAYALDIDAGGDGWVRVAGAGGASRVAVSYSAGTAADWAAVPGPVAQGCVLLVVHLFEHRDGVAMPPAAVAALWRPYRMMRLAETVR